MIIGCVLVGIASIRLNSFADEWGLPEPTRYYSSNKIYCFEVIPKRLKEDNYCKGALYKIDEKGNYHQLWIIRLSNEASPVSVIVSNNGSYIVTFDNWHSVGFGDDVVVIYGSDGRLIKKFGLEDIISDEEINRIPRSISSRWWGGKHYLDEKRGVLILKIVSNNKMPNDEGAMFREIKIDLKTGMLMKP